MAEKKKAHPAKQKEHKLEKKPNTHIGGHLKETIESLDLKDKIHDIKIVEETVTFKDTEPEVKKTNSGKKKKEAKKLKRKEKKVQKAKKKEAKKLKRKENKEKKLKKKAHPTKQKEHKVKKTAKSHPKEIQKDKIDSTTKKVDTSQETTTAKEKKTEVKKSQQKVEKEPKNRVEIIEKHAKADKVETLEDVKVAEQKKKDFKQRERKLNKITKSHSKEVLDGKIVSTTQNTPNVEENVIELFDVKKAYLTGDLEYEVLKGVNLKIKKGTFVVILGPSGSGKTTLLNIISGLDKANQGDVFVAGYNLSLLKDSHLTKFRRDNVGFIFQQYNLLTNLTARENAEVGENLAKTKNKELGIDEIFKVIEMDEHMNKFPSQLSGGQQQRVSIGRALAKNPKILFCDEPTGALDEEMGRKVLEILLDVNKAYGTSIIMVTHNPNFQFVADTIINVKNGKITSVKNNAHTMKPSEINWS